MNYYGNYKPQKRYLHTYHVSIKLDCKNSNSLMIEDNISLINPGPDAQEVAAHEAVSRCRDIPRNYSRDDWEIIEVTEIDKTLLRDE